MTDTTGQSPRRVFITGANRGLGYEVAKILIGQGDRVWGSAREARPRALLDLHPAGTIQMDLGDTAGLAKAAVELAAQTDGLDLLINCAAIDARALGGSDDGRGPLDIEADMFTEVLRINVTGPLVTTREVLPLLLRSPAAMVVNFSSQLGSMEVGRSSGRDVSYNASKAALNMVSLKMATALEPDGIGVVMLHPGWVRTDMGGERGQLDPAEAARHIVETIDTLTLADTGRFIRWDGSDHPW